MNKKLKEAFNKELIAYGKLLKTMSVEQIVLLKVYEKAGWNRGLIQDEVFK